MVIDLSALTAPLVQTGLLVFCRIASALMVYPGVGDTVVPPRIRMALALVCTVLITPLLAHPAFLLNPQGVSGPLAPAFLGSLATETAFGLMSGLLVRIFFLTLETVGTVWGMSTGLSQALLFQPTLNQPGSLWGHFLTTAGIALVMASDGHHLFLKGLLHSFQTMPPGHPVGLLPWADMTARAGTACIHLAWTLGAPLLAFSLLFHVALGLLSRVMPHVQVFFVAQPLQILLGTGVVWLVLGPGLLLFLSVFQTLRQGM